MLSVRNRLSIVFALGIGWFVGGFSASSPSAIAQVARVTLDSLQTQLNNIVGGTTKVGKAVTADNATSLGGFAAADYVKADELVAISSTVTNLQAIVSNLQATSPIARTYNVSTSVSATLLDRDGNALPENFTAILFASATSTSGSATSYWLLKRPVGGGSPYFERLASFGSTSSNTPEVFATGTGVLSLRLFNHPNVYAVKTQLFQIVP